MTLVSYSTSDTEYPSGRVIVEARYEDDHTTVILIVIGCLAFLIVSLIASLVSAYVTTILL